MGSRGREKNRCIYTQKGTKCGRAGYLIWFYASTGRMLPVRNHGYTIQPQRKAFPPAICQPSARQLFSKKVLNNSKFPDLPTVCSVEAGKATVLKCDSTNKLQDCATSPCRPSTALLRSTEYCVQLLGPVLILRSLDGQTRQSCARAVQN